MKVLTFGEMMLRLKPVGNNRIIQSDVFEAAYGGAEANVAVSLSLLGNNAAYLTKLPKNLLGETALSTLRKYGVDTTKVLRGGNRLGIYFFEKGASVRATNVVYDRAGSAFAEVKQTEFNWEAIFRDVDYFYFSGITPAISVELEQAVTAACVYCQKHNIPVVCDMNYRGKMWLPEKAQTVMSRLMHYVTICIANDEDFEATLGIKAFDGDMSRGIEQIDAFKDGMQEVTRRYPGCKMVVSVLRNIQSVEDSQWMGLLLSEGTFYETNRYNVHVMEGVAAGDAFGAGLMHSLLHKFDTQEAIEFAIAASVLKLTISGDLNLVQESDIRAVMKKGGGASLSR
ncbi:sugar kinase [Prodigiosinella confusarubida]|uniref:Sugar kinase n=1 Tax=Serratia sp. (strain ATCC 39006) TaxID=104623 RepID=A0A2I5TM56_SERS3|nr:sugar kinase [Serratia sp. ATCC 39006]AUH01331.1 sugar kinase [Serratia sp. ATCC 39006]AUH05652.1 sugar kinase [Serratia sp. ATCC 39006]